MGKGASVQNPPVLYAVDCMECLGRDPFFTHGAHSAPGQTACAVRDSPIAVERRTRMGSRIRWALSGSGLAADKQQTWGKATSAGVVQWQNVSFPSSRRGFDSRHPLHPNDPASAGAVTRRPT